MPRPARPALLIVATVLTGCPSALAGSQHEALNVITVTVTGRISVKPDWVLVNVGVEARAPALVDAMAEGVRQSRVGDAPVRQEELRIGAVEHDHC